MDKSVKKRAGSLPCGRLRPAPETPVRPADRRVQELVERLENYCAEKGLRTSSARRKIVEVIVKDLIHFTSQQLLDQMDRRHPDVGRATLYRTIPVLVEAGILQEGPKTVEGQPSYELAEKRHHDHIVCLDCRAIFEFSNASIEKEQDELTEKLDFLPRNHMHVIYAHCQRLKK